MDYRGSNRIPGLELLQEEIPVEVETGPAAPGFRRKATLQARFDQPGWTLYVEYKENARTKRFHFREKGGKKTIEWRMDLEGSRSKIGLSAVGPLGQVRRAEMEVAYEEPPPPKPVPPRPTPPSQNPTATKPPPLLPPLVKERSTRFARSGKSWRLASSLGVSSFNYAQSDYEDLSGISLVAKVSYSRKVGESRWDWGGNAFGTALPISTSRPGVSLRFVGANARVGYLLRKAKNVEFTLHMGFYYSTTLVTGENLGYFNIGGPQLFPTAHFHLKRDHGIVAYFKLSPMTDGASVLELRNREVAGGLTWVIPAPNAILISVDVANLSLLTEATVKTTSYTLSAGISL